MVRALGHGLELALRSAATPLFLGMRWASPRRETRPDDVPAPRWSLGLAAKAALDELFVATELISAMFLSLWDRERMAQDVAEALDLIDERGWLADPAL